MKASKKSSYGKTMRIDITPDEVRRLKSFKKGKKLRLTSRKRYVLRPADARVSKGAESDRNGSKYTKLLQGLYDAVLLTDLDGTIIETNHRATEFLLYGSEELRTMSVLDILYTADTRLLSMVKKHLRGQRHALVQCYCVRRDASMFAGEIAVNMLEFDQPVLCFVLRDVTEAKKAQNELRIQHEAVKHSPNGVAIVALDGQLEYVNPACVSMWGFRDAREMTKVNLADLWKDTPEMLELIADLQADPTLWFGELVGVTKDLTEIDVLVSANCIRNEDEELIGIVFSFVDNTERKKAQRELEMYRDNLEALVKERTREIEETQLEIVRRLGQAAEQRDSETGAHITRLNCSCYVLARAAGLPLARCEMLLEASAMHDVGKVSVPDAILQKPGPLTSEEYEIMKHHVAQGAELLSGLDSPLFKMARSIALTHHERWDGGGYPNGLAGEAIPVEGRLVAICDVFDALVSERCYKEKWPVEKAVEELKTQRGKAFDPHLVDVFIANLDSILSVIREVEEGDGDGILGVDS